MPVSRDSSPMSRRILLSCFACSPQWGSEPGVGWHWLLHLARDYEVTLVTHAYFREHLETALIEAGLGDLEVHYLQAPAFGRHPHKQLNSRIYYSWWQWHLRHYVRKLIAERPRFDLLHHLTWGTLRFPCMLGGLGVPLVMGPLGGGEFAPLRFFDGLPLKLRLFDYIRSITLAWVRLDPLATWGPRSSTLVLCKSSESLNALPRSVRARAVVVPEIGSPPPEEPARGGDDLPPTQSGQPFRLLFAGRLLGWKGVSLAVGAAATLIRNGYDVTLDIAGDGPLRGHLAERIEREGLGERVRLLGAIERQRLLGLYARCDLFVFPSLHDSSGNVVLEALSRGLPVLCLDLGGPRLYVDADCGIVVPTAGLSRAGLESAIAQAIAELLREPVRRANLSRHAFAHARRQTWEAAVRNAYGHIASALQWKGA